MISLKYNHKNIQELSYSYHKLQQQIDNIIKSDILNIVDVNSELLIENFIVRTLLDDRENNHQDNIISESTSTQTITNLFPQSIYAPPEPNIQPISSKRKVSPF